MPATDGIYPLCVLSYCEQFAFHSAYSIVGVLLFFNSLIGMWFLCIRAGSTMMVSRSIVKQGST